MQTIGTCGKCDGPVQVPEFWGGTVPPVPTCAHCGATARDPYGPTIPMEKRSLCRTDAVGIDGCKVTLETFMRPNAVKPAAQPGGSDNDR